MSGGPLVQDRCPYPTLPWTLPSLGPSATLPSLAGADRGEGQAVVMMAKSADSSPIGAHVHTCVLLSIVSATPRQCATPFGRSGREAQPGQPLTQERTVVRVRMHTWVSLPPKPRPLPEADLLLWAWPEPSPAGQAHPVGPTAPLQGF